MSIRREAATPARPEVPVTVNTVLAFSPSGTSMISNITEDATATNRTLGSTDASNDGAPADTINSIQDLIRNLDLEDEKGGDGGDSDVEGEEVNNHVVVHNKDMDFDVEASTEVDDDGELKAMVKMTRAGGTEVICELAEDGSVVGGGNSYNVAIPKPDPSWMPPTVKNDKGEPEFHLVDNPGGWDRYYYQPKFASAKEGGKYVGHALPTGAMPVPVGVDGKRKCGAWEFHYKGFKNDAMPYRRGATTSNLFPKEMEGHLDATVLKRLGLTAERVKVVDALFFYQLLLPFCDPKKSGVANDPRVAYYTEVERFTNASAALSGQGSSYGHTWKATSACELLKFDGVLFYDGSLGGSGGAIYRRWDQSCCMYNKDIANAMTLTRWGELKRNMKLCLNQSCPKRGERNYDPAYKYDLIYQVMVSNTNAISAKADENQVIDESTWGHSGYGESGTGLTGRLRNKKKDKGGQIVFIMDRNRFRIRGYMHRNKIYDELYPEEKRGWTSNGPFEVKYLADQLLKMCDGSPGDAKKLFEKKPTITADNFFESDQSLEYLGEKGFGGIMTSARDKLPRDIKSKYLHKLKTDPKSKPAKIARFAQPIVAVKNDPNGKYQRVHVSFQSTSSCNISTVNALNEIFHFVELRERGRGLQKRYWVIEMNHSRRVYLTTYNGIDVLDHLLQNARLFYRTWKYWHAPKNHALSIVVAVAYDIYLEVCEGKIEAAWKVEKPVSRWEFQNKLAEQALTYSPKKNLYPGDSKLRANTVIPLRQRRAAGPDRDGNVTRTQLQMLTESEQSRGCGDLDKLCRHIASSVKVPKGRVCSWCGKMAYQACGICKDSDGKPVALHLQKKASNNTILPMCFWNYHNDACIGLGKDDSSLIRKRKKSDWDEPSNRERQENREHINQLKARFR